MKRLIGFMFIALLAFCSIGSSSASDTKNHDDGFTVSEYQSSDVVSVELNDLVADIPETYFIRDWSFTYVVTPVFRISNYNKAIAPACRPPDSNRCSFS